MGYKHEDGSAIAELRNYKFVAAQFFKQNGKNSYRGVAPYPVTPAIGDKWEELDATGLFLESWYWNGTYWLSERIYNWFFDTIGNTAAAAVNWPVNPATNIYLTDLITAVSTTVANSATNGWTWTLSRVTAANVATTITSNNSLTGGQAATTWRTYRLAI
jgi:hypothetical protein